MLMKNAFRISSPNSIREKLQNHNHANEMSINAKQIGFHTNLENDQVIGEVMFIIGVRLLPWKNNKCQAT